MRRFFLRTLFLLGFAASPAWAESSNTGYARVNFRDMVQSLVGLGGVDVSNPEVADHYAEILYCDSFINNFRNDFEWQKIRQTLQGFFLEQKANYRTLYEFGGPVYIDRYDFKTQSFPILRGGGSNIGTMMMYKEDQFVPYCRRRNFSEFFPQYYELRLRTPLNLNRLSMEEKAAVAFVKRMDAQKNTERKVYVRFRAKLYGSEGVIGGGFDNRRGIFVGSIEEVDFFEDKDLTIYLGAAR